MEIESVLSQACLAIFSLAVKRKNDRVHNGNTRKLVTKGAIECVITAIQKYPADTTIQRAGAMAVASLGRLEANRIRLGGSGVCDLILHAFTAHPTSSPVLSKMAVAIDVLCQGDDVNKAKFANGGAIDFLLAAMHKHEKSPQFVGTKTVNSTIDLVEETGCITFLPSTRWHQATSKTLT